jgi:hypothetical protein
MASVVMSVREFAEDQPGQEQYRDYRTSYGCLTHACRVGPMSRARNHGRTSVPAVPTERSSCVSTKARLEAATKLLDAVLEKVSY